VKKSGVHQNFNGIYQEKIKTSQMGVETHQKKVSGASKSGQERLARTPITLRSFAAN
jgi:hypothetical protein